MGEDEQVAVLKAFYDKHSPKDEDAILAILQKRKADGEKDQRLPSDGFKTLCGKLEKLYKENPIDVYQGTQETGSSDKQDL
eukprot:SAG31_NODE_1808_length_7230_cov_32.785835_2_plen_81_part_00